VSRRHISSCFIAAAVCGAMISGCFSFQVKERIDDAGDDLRKDYGEALDWGFFPGPRHLLCTQVCADSTPTWRLDAADIPLYLRLLSDEAVITDSLPSCSPPGETRSLDLAFSSSPLDFHPSDSGRIATALLQLEFYPGATWPGQTLSMRQGSTFLFSRHDTVRSLPVNASLHRVRPNDVTCAKLRASIPFLVSVPADIVTSPFQLLFLAVIAHGMKNMGH
jgi:hypothetical protein